MAHWPLTLPPITRHQPCAAHTPKPGLQPLAPPEPAARRARPGCEIEANQWCPHVLALDRIRTWSSPYAQARQRHLLAIIPASEFDKAYAAVIGGLAPKTHENYAAGLLRFHQYCDTHRISEGMRMPAPYFLLTAFIADWIGRVGGGTVKSWMSGLKA
jgi:hypothetical protein